VLVILLGDESGIAEAAREVGAEHVPHIERTKYGIPLFNSAFAAAARGARHRLLCYSTAISCLIRAAASIRKREFLMVGRRWVRAR
jgi:hypothetical protein